MITAAVVAAAVAVDGPFFWYSCNLKGLEPRGQAQASILYAANGTRIGTLDAGSNRVPVGYAQISPAMRAAIIAAEDRRFYRNNGVDYLAVLRALKADLSAGQVSQGGSTLTQQLVRNLYLSSRRTLSRKLTEGCLAVKLDQTWSKHRILTTYLNEVYFGHRAYGIEAAARTYFGVPAKDLTLDQAALLAGLPQSPSAYDPLVHPDTARIRRAEVLRSLYEIGSINGATLRRTLAEPLGLHRAATAAGGNAYLTDYITTELVSLYGAEPVRRGGLRVHTTLDARLQQSAERAITAALNRPSDPAGALIAIDPRTGAIKAMAVAQTQHRLAFNIVTDGRRQAGSTFKPFVLTEAILRGINPWTTRYLSAPFTGPANWHVQTYEHTYSGSIPLSQATVASDNTVYARLTLDLGTQRIARIAHALGIQSELRPIPPIGLGVNPASPLDLATAYSTLAANGTRHAPIIVDNVAFSDGHSSRPGHAPATQVLDPKVAAQVTKVLIDNVNAGTGTAAALHHRPAAGKTGTTDNYADAWFAGYTPQLVTVVWVGYPNKERPMRRVHGIRVVGGTFPARIWHTFMTHALHGTPVIPFANPGPPRFRHWCGRYQFAHSTLDARPYNGCPTHHPKPRRTTTRVTHTHTVTQPPITTTKTVTVHTITTQRTRTATTTHTTSTTTTTSGTTRMTTTSGYTIQPDASTAVGQQGTVVRTIDATGNGVIQIGSLYYKAMNATDANQTIAAGTQVTVTNARGDTAYVST